MTRSDYLQEWNFDPVRTIPADAPQPWYVAGYSFKAVDNVLRVDYLAARIRAHRSIYEVPGGKITYIGHPEELRGLPHGVGTLFLLWGGRRDDDSNVMRIYDDARLRVAEIRELLSGVPSKE